MDRLTTLSAVLVGILLASCATPLKAPPYPDTLFSLRKHPVVGIIGDTQRTGFIEVWRERNNPQREALLRQIARERPDALLHLGDMVFYGSYEDDWRYFDDVMSPLRSAGIPIYPVLGNHEYFGTDATMLDYVRERFPDLKDLWYVKVIDSVAYVMLNTNYRDIGMYEMSRQWVWYVHQMDMLKRDPSVLFIVVLGHHPPYTNSTVVDDEDLLQQYFVPAYMLNPKAAVWFSGHSHAYEHFYKDLKHFVVSGGGGGPRQRVLTKEYQQHPDMYDGDMVRPFHYCTVERRDSILHITMRPLRLRGITPARADSFAIALPTTSAYLQP